LAQRMKVTEVVKELGIHEVTCYRWCREYGRMKLSQMKRLKELEKENAQLRKAVLDLTHNKMIPQEATSSEPDRRRSCIDAVGEHPGVSERRACRMLQQFCATIRYSTARGGRCID